MSDNFDDFSDYYEEYDDSYDGLEASPPAEEWDEDDLIAGGSGGAVEVDTAVGNGDEPPPPKSNRLKIILGVVFVVFVLPLLCFLCFFLFSGAAIFSALLNLDETSIIMEEGLEEDNPIATFVPTAAVLSPATATPEPTPTPTISPPSATFVSPTNNAQITLGESIEIVVEVTDPNGITSLSIAGSGVSPQNFSGETEVTFRERWSPENPGQYTFNVVLRSRASTTLITLEGITVTVVTGNEGDTEEDTEDTEESADE